MTIPHQGGLLSCVGKENKQESTNVVAALKACARREDLKEGVRIHAEVLKRGLLLNNCYVASTLINMYAKCGALVRAAALLDELLPQSQNVVSWNALIAGYTQKGKNEEALKCFSQMQGKGVCPDAVTFVCILKACGSIGVINRGEQIHREVVSKGLLEDNVVLGNALVDMYAKFGQLVKAACILDELPFRDVVSWNTLITGYAHEGQGEEALKYFELMQGEGHSPDIVTFISILKACGSIGAADKGKETHDELVRRGLLGKDVVLDTALVNMYAKCGSLSKASQVLFELPFRNVVTWSSLITGYAENGQGKEALECYKRMRQEGLLPNIVTYICLLKACANLEDVDQVEQVHEEIIEQGLLIKDVVLGNALVDVYVKCGALAKASQVLDELPVRDVVSWNILIAGYVQEGENIDAIKSLKRMQRDGIFPNMVTFACLLKACGNVGKVDIGEEVHQEIASQQLLGKNIALDINLVDMYAKCGALAKAAQLIDELPVQRVVLWNALMAGYVHLGWGEEVLKCFKQFERKGLFPDRVTFICLLKACGSLGVTAWGEQIHQKILKEKLLERDHVLGNALIDMYVKCGAISKAAQVLCELPVRDVVSWSALIAGYAQLAESERAIACFKQMQCEGLSPNAVTLVCMLTVCSRSGLLNEGQMHFVDMSNKYGIRPNVEHHTCMLDLFGCAGQIQKLFCAINNMSSSNDLPFWLALLCACQKTGNVMLARHAFTNAVKIDKNDGAAYVLMTRIYASVGMHEDAKTIETMKKKYRMEKFTALQIINHGFARK